MGILSGIVSYLFGLALNLLDAAIAGFLGALGFDLGTFEEYFPAVTAYYEVIIGLGVGLLFMMLIFQIFRNFGVMLDMEAEDPLKMLGKTALFFGMIMYSRSITDFIIRLLVDPYSIFINVAPDPYEFKLTTMVTSMFTSVFSNPFMAIVALILMLILGWQFLKLIIECVERYIVFCFVIVIAPVVFATGAFKSTEQIFKSWCRMLASQALLLLINVWSINLFMSFLPIFESNMHNIIFNFLIGYAFLQFAQQADTLLRILGLNAANTGDMMRSLGGTIAGIAFTVRSLSSAAGSVASAAGKIFGGGAQAASGVAGGAARSAGNVVSGMAGTAAYGARNVAGAVLGSTGAGIASSIMSSAKQGYVGDVLNSARSQSGGEQAANNDDTANSNAQRFRYEEDFAGGLRENMGGGSNNGIDMETREGLANIAHGLPHNRFDPASRTFSGGGFPEFTGENANMVGASQLSPADGFEQHSVGMQDGSHGTLYQNSETGEAHLVQFGSVDNGVIQGTISQLDSETGQFGDFMGFKAVHESVPGAESFSGHSIPVSDSEGGVYHVSTGASTSFFAPGNSSMMSGSAGSVSSDVGSAPSTVTGGLGESDSSSSDTGSHNESPIPSPNSDFDWSTMYGGGSSRGAGASRSHGRGFRGGGEFGGRGAPSPPGEDLGSRGGGGRSGGESDSPPINTGMSGQPDSPGRFSRNNPSNIEVFGREGSGAESFDRTAPNPSSLPNMGSYDDK